MTYNRFAYVYDQLMKDTPYDQWVEMVVRKAEQYDVKVQTVLDVACGTGELSCYLAEAGFKVTGLDLSEDMLAVAQQKSLEQGFHIPFFQQDMSEMEGFGSFDVITIFCDSLNYLQTEDEVKNTFKKVLGQLEKDGLFMFDVHSQYKVNELFKNHTFALNDLEVAYIWDCFEGEWANSVEHDLSFFVLDKETNKYDRFDEFHMQRTFSIAQYQDWLQETGFEILDVTADFEDKPPSNQSERIFFTCRKKQ